MQIKREEIMRIDIISRAMFHSRVHRNLIIETIKTPFSIVYYYFER